MKLVQLGPQISKQGKNGKLAQRGNSDGWNKPLICLLNCFSEKWGSRKGWTLGIIFTLGCLKINLHTLFKITCIFIVYEWVKDCGVVFTEYRENVHYMGCLFNYRIGSKYCCKVRTPKLQLARYLIKLQSHDLRNITITYFILLLFYQSRHIFVLGDLF